MPMHPCLCIHPSFQPSTHPPPQQCPRAPGRPPALAAACRPAIPLHWKPVRARIACALRSLKPQTLPNCDPSPMTPNLALNAPPNPTHFTMQCTVNARSMRAAPRTLSAPLSLPPHSSRSPRPRSLRVRLPRLSIESRRQVRLQMHQLLLLVLLLLYWHNTPTLSTPTPTPPQPQTHHWPPR